MVNVYSEPNLAMNTEITIDYKKKEVKFNKSCKEDKTNLAYFSNNYYWRVGFIGWILMILIILIHYLPKYNEAGFLIGSTNKYTSFMLLLLIGFELVLAYTSLIVHKISVTARKNFPKTNAVLSLLIKKKVIIEDLPPHKHFEGGHIQNNELIITDYDIVRFDYSYTGENKIKKIQTKSAEPIGHKGEHYNFIAIFEFEKPLTEGLFEWR